jgi:hypothetical protein
MHNVDLPNLPVQKGIHGAFLFMVCITLHIICVKSAGLEWDLKAFAGGMDLDTVVSVASGLGSIATAVVLVQHYALRNKALRQELKERKLAEQAEEKEDAK